MALLKCPECENIVSEHANCCMRCGCRIEYILDYYEKLRTEKETKKKAKKSTTPIMETLSEKERSVIFRIKSALDSRKASYFLDIRNEFVGFRKEKSERLSIYLSRHSDGSLFIHIRNPEKNSNEGFPFDEEQIDGYVSAGVRLLSGESETEDSSEEPNPSERSGNPSLEELKQRYHFTVSWGKVLPIEIVEIVLKDSLPCVYYILNGQGWKFCSLEGIEGKLFETEEEALRSLEKPRTITDEIRENQSWRKASEEKGAEEYVLFHDGQYLIGFHDRTFYDSEFPISYSTKRSSTYAVAEVPDYGSLAKALVFYSKESAEKMAKELEEQTGYRFEVKLRRECR